MLTVEEKGSTHTSPKRRVLIIVGVVLAFLVVAAIGVVVGYFIGRSDGGKKSQTPVNLENIHKEAVEMVSTDELRSNLK